MANDPQLCPPRPRALRSPARGLAAGAGNPASLSRFTVLIERIAQAVSDLLQPRRNAVSAAR